MSYETILYGVENGVATITLNRPDRMNAWNEQLAAELSEALVAANQDDAVRAVVVTGTGKAFCAGADIARGGGTWAGPRAQGPSERDAPRAARPKLTFPWQIDKPVIAAINGHAVGVGITYAMLCDVRFVAEDAKIQFAFVRRGIIPELAAHSIVPRVIGFSRAADLLMSGRMIHGKEAAELGLASKALAADAVLKAAHEHAREYASAAPVSVAICKRLLWEGLSLSVPEMRKREDPLFAWSGRQADAREGVVSFLEKRAPAWTLSVNKDKPEGV
jgi:enoyl-CoA hydratase/carnithine racemase